MNVFIGGAWVYANGSLHLGHIASLLPGDILARYFRLKGQQVLYVSGSDCNGTPIAVKARREGVPASTIANQYHQEFIHCYQKLGFTYDSYSRTDSTQHHHVVQEVFMQLMKKGYIFRKDVEQTFCQSCDQFLPDRFVVGNCPVCDTFARGDQCDHCSTILDPLELNHRKCSICGTEPAIRDTEHFYFKLSQLQNFLEGFTLNAETNSLWRENALSLTSRYLQEGLKDRAVSRDLPIGVSVPIEGYENKKIYVWVEAVIGYLSASKIINQSESFWEKDTISYYVHGKDNIPFHTIFWPAILKGIEHNGLPTHIISNEYLTLEKKKLSTSKNWAVWLPDFLEKYDPDSLRYFLTINAAEKRDADFSWREFIYSHNSELLGAYGNFVNRTFQFVVKFFEGKLNGGEVNQEIVLEMEKLYLQTGERIEKANLKFALEEIFSYVRKSNKYFDEKQPWKQVKENRENCEQILKDCSFIIINLANLLSPFLPFSSEKILKMAQIESTEWKPIQLNSLKLLNVAPIFQRIDEAKIQTEVELLHKQGTEST
ncbi:methionine--tRNA ligase [Sutcliffiella rhizosphaerae]|uniref:Methionine--tRNA ligase n=1 Tax=Sutcliffiella rhizosphaerae TaxID=2880967 RepID=A0ABM8YUE1_9BACI|nr:methionine--tRNA ligase [Sutcliffiella rhizosphaerae]CAG9623572.1 Methionine--tRNA ligase [Sutcliffiella rhizosphaerae]